MLSLCLCKFSFNKKNYFSYVTNSMKKVKTESYSGGIPWVDWTRMNFLLQNPSNSKVNWLQGLIRMLGGIILSM